MLAVVAAEHQKHGRCTLVIDHIAALAGVGRTTVKNALREAQRQSLLRIEERRVSAWRNAPNVVTLTSPEWLSWLRMRTRGVGSKPQPPRIQENKKSTAAQRNRPELPKDTGCFGQANEIRNAIDRRSPPTGWLTKSSVRASKIHRGKGNFGGAHST